MLPSVNPPGPAPHPADSQAAPAPVVRPFVPSAGEAGDSAVASGGDSASVLHSLTWLLWAAAAATSLQIAPNPLYVAVVIAVAALVFETHRRDSALSRAFPLLIAVGLAFCLLRVVLMVLTTHGGTDAFLTVPEATLPRLLGGFTVGGDLEWVVLWDAVAQGLVVVGVMAVFGTFNSVASHHELLQSVPRAFHEPGLIVTVAVAFVPSTLTAIATVREADQARTGGRRVRRGRLVRLAVPVLESGLERAVSLAESMDSRGFGRGRASRTERASAWLGLTCLLGLGGAVVALVGAAAGLAAVLVAIGSAALVGGVLLAPGGGGPTRYRRRRFAAVDFLVLVTALACPAGLALGAIAGVDGLRWTASVPLAAPRFHLLPALCLALLAVPALIPRPTPVDDDHPIDEHRSMSTAR